MVTRSSTSCTISINISIESYLQIFRNADTLSRNWYGPHINYEEQWYKFVIKTRDVQILEMIPLLSEIEMRSIGYYALILGRLGLLRQWWWDPKMPKPDTYNSWRLIAVGMYASIYSYQGLNVNKLQIKKVPSLQAFLVLIKASFLKQRLSGISKIKGANKIAFLKCLIDIASRIPYGITKLIKEYKIMVPKQEYWVFPDSGCKIQEDLSVKDLSWQGGVSLTPLQKVSRYGNRKDLYFFMRHPDFWTNIDVGNQQFTPLTLVTVNHDITTFKMFLYLYTSIQKVLDSFPPEIGQKIWGNCIYSQIFSQESLEHALHYLYQCQIKSRLKRVRLLVDTFKFMDARILTNYVPRDLLLTYFPDLLYCAYNYFIEHEVPVSPAPQYLLYHTTNSHVLVSPKADGISYIGHLPACAYPRVGVLYHRIKAEKLVLSDNRIIYLIFDVEISGNWQQRLQRASDLHPYASCAQTLGAENQELTNFLAATTDKKVLWWSKGVHAISSGVKGILGLLDKPPITPYPNDGWILTTNNGAHYKVKPSEHLTIDIAKEAAWNVTPFQDPDSPPFKAATDGDYAAGIWRCYWNPQEQVWVPKTLRTDKEHANSSTIVQNLTRQHLYPWSPGQLCKFITRPYYKGAKIKRSREMTQLIQKQRDLITKFRDSFPCVYPGSLNIGCGYRGRTGDIDIDPYIVSEKGGHWVDGATFKNPLTGEPFTTIAKSAQLIYTLHFLVSDKKQLANFMDSMARFQELLIVIIDGDLFGESYKFLDGSSMRKVSPGWSKGTWHVERHVNSHKSRELLISTSFIKNRILGGGKWEIHGSAPGELGLQSTLFYLKSTVKRKDARRKKVAKKTISVALDSLHTLNSDKK